MSGRLNNFLPKIAASFNNVNYPSTWTKNLHNMHIVSIIKGVCFLPIRVGIEIFLHNVEWAAKIFSVKRHLTPLPPVINKDRSLGLVSSQTGRQKVVKREPTMHNAVCTGGLKLGSKSVQRKTIQGYSGHISYFVQMLKQVSVGIYLLSITITWSYGGIDLQAQVQYINA